jgi:hypothetical protein|nr:MAG TPA: hypothetical protein [Caudoviricetes sp.]
MNLKDIMEEIIEMLPDNCSAEYFTGEYTAWYLESDVINYLRSYAEQYEKEEDL